MGMWIVNWKLHLYALSLSYFKFWTEQSIVPKPWEAKLCLDAGNRNCDCDNPFIFNCDIPFIGFSFDSLLTKWLGFLVFVAAVAVLGNAEGSSGGTLLADVVFLSGYRPFQIKKLQNVKQYGKRNEQAKVCQKIFTIPKIAIYGKCMRSCRVRCLEKFRASNEISIFHKECRRLIVQRTTVYRAPARIPLPYNTENLQQQLTAFGH